MYQEDQFIAPSNYLLAYIQTHENGILRTDIDYTPALLRLQRVIDDDPTYSPAYYLKAKLLANSRQTNAALDALEKAVFSPRYGYVPCSDINDGDEVKASFSSLVTQERFMQLQRDCRQINHIAQASQEALIPNVQGRDNTGSNMGRLPEFDVTVNSATSAAVKRAK